MRCVHSTMQAVGHEMLPLSPPAICFSLLNEDEGRLQSVTHPAAGNGALGLLQRVSCTERVARGLLHIY